MRPRPGASPGGQIQSRVIRNDTHKRRRQRPKERTRTRKKRGKRRKDRSGRDTRSAKVRSENQETANEQN